VKENVLPWVNRDEGIAVRPLALLDRSRQSLRLRHCRLVQRLSRQIVTFAECPARTSRCPTHTVWLKSSTDLSSVYAVHGHGTELGF
jgi:hypothetical protein